MQRLRLAEFIDQHRVEIVKEWEIFARSISPPGKPMTGAELRDHADEILTAIVADMGSSQSRRSQVEKSKGHRDSGQLTEIGNIHAVLRIDSGFKLAHIVAEYRALRASILRLWEHEAADPSGVTRFNEAIDEALTEAVACFAASADEFRDQAVGALGHDLRNPLSTVIVASSSLIQSDELDEGQLRMLTRIASSAKAMTRIVADLIDLTQTRFGEVITITRTALDLEPLCRQVLANLDAREADGASVVTFTTSGDLRGTWDAARIEQALVNLLSNATKHRARDKVAVVASDDGRDVVISVRNGGPPIAPKMLVKILEPHMRRVADPADRFLGLSLYVAAQIAIAHGGALTATSTAEAGTIFTLRLPRTAAATAEPTTTMTGESS